MVPVLRPLFTPLKGQTTPNTGFGLKTVLGQRCAGHELQCKELTREQAEGYLELIDWNFLIDRGTKMANMIAIPSNTVSIGF